MKLDCFASRLNMAFKCFILLLYSDLIFSYTYPLYGTKHYLRTVPIRRSAYVSIPVPRYPNECQLPDYDSALEGYMPASQDEYEYVPYEKYPFVQYLGYYPSLDYYHDKAARRSSDGLGYFEDRMPQDEVPEEILKEESYPYEQESWFEEDLPQYDSNAEANAAFLQNLIMAQMYQDVRHQKPVAYDSSADDYDDQHWFYGVPTTEVEDKERVKQYFKNKEDEEVRELESLVRKKEKSKKMKEKTFSKQRKMNVMEKPTKSKSKMTDDEYFDMQKQIIVNNRKNSHGPVGESLRLSKKQIYDPVGVKNWNFQKPAFNSHLGSYLDSATNSIKKLNFIKDDKNLQNVVFSDKSIDVESTTTATVSTTASPKRPHVIGQKEVVLPRPSNPVRRPLTEISTRNLHQPSVYDTIKRLLNMEKDFQKSEISQPQKRFVLNEDQLTAELSGLKKLSA